MGLTAYSNYTKIALIIKITIEWEKRSSVIFKADKINLIYFTYSNLKVNKLPAVIKG